MFNPGSSFTKIVYSALHPRISPIRPELSQARKTVLVTRGSTGIGLTISRAFAEADAERVVILGRHGEKPQIVASTLGSAQLWDALDHDIIIVDVLVLNAAAVTAASILNEGRQAVWQSLITNAHGHLAFAERLYRRAAAAKRSSVSIIFRILVSGSDTCWVIVNVSTQVIHDLYIGKKYPAYSASKCAGTMLLQKLALDVDTLELQVVSFHPGVVLTEATQAAGPEEADLLWDDGGFIFSNPIDNYNERRNAHVY
ncbi:hypothetical protein HJFPF1_04542 [Paramyrothecium foliicola]|nr:hypothetical protein HJFPF1_04542 [Paramyrothecium foliicola]